MARYDVKHSKLSRLKDKVVTQLKPKAHIIPQSKWDKMQFDLDAAQKEARFYKRIAISATFGLVLAIIALSI